MPKEKKEGGSESIYDLLYGSPEFRKQEKKEKKPREELGPPKWFLSLAKSGYKYFGKSAKLKKAEKQKLENTLAYLGWKLEPEEVRAAGMFVLAIGLVLGMFWMIVNLFLSMSGHQVWINLSPNATSFFGVGYGGEGATTILGFGIFDNYINLLLYIAPMLIAAIAAYFVMNLPYSEAQKQRIRSLSYIPEIVNYFVMAMKVNPNLEKALEFVAEHGHGRIAEDVRKLLWDIKTGKYRTTEEALDDLAWKWGEYSEEFKHALMLIRSSVMEADEMKRAALLDRALQDTLAGIKEKMDMYSRQMHQPSVYLYYVGVMLPLILIIIAPVGALMGGGQLTILSQLPVMILLYNIIIPIGSFYYAKMILERRPPTRPVPQIPDDMPGLPKRGWFKIGKYELPVYVISGAIFVAMVAVGFMIEPVLNPKPPAWMHKSWFPFWEITGVILGLVYAVSFWLWANHKDKRKVQLEIVEMENQFQDSLYVLASRLGEGRPIEEALRYAAEFLPTSIASKRLFLPTLHNIKMLGMTLKMALFDPAYGSLKWVPSEFIKTTMKIVVDSMTLGVQTAARSLASLSLQLRDMQKVESALKAMLEDITNMMGAMATFIAPIVLGITVALQKIIIGALKNLSKSGLGTKPAGTTAVPANIPGANLMTGGLFGGKAGGLEHAATQEQLFFVVSLYMIEIIFVMVYFASHVREGKNDLAFKMALARTLPIGMTIFFATAFFAMKMTAIGF